MSAGKGGEGASLPLVTFHCDTCDILFDLEGRLERGDDWEFIPATGVDADGHCPNDPMIPMGDNLPHETGLVLP